MKDGLLAILGKGMPSKGGMMASSKGGAPDPDAGSEESEDSSAREYAKLFVDAMKSGDDEAAIDALVSLKDC